eukprot:2913016-Pyramimonas_sp.AAC.1
MAVRSTESYSMASVPDEEFEEGVSVGIPSLFLAMVLCLLRVSATGSVVVAFLEILQIAWIGAAG